MTADTQIHNLENVLKDAKNSLLKKISRSPQSCFESYNLDVLIENAREKLHDMKESTRIVRKSSDTKSPRIPDLSANDKKKIIDLVDLLAKTNEEKEKCNSELSCKRTEIENYEARLTKLQMAHTREQQKLLKQVTELKTVAQRTEQCKDAEITIAKTEKEIQIKKLKYDNALKIQEIELQMRDEFQKMRSEKDVEITKMQKRINMLENEIDSKVKPLTEKDILSQKIIDVLKKEKIDHEGKINSCKLKLRTAIDAIQKLKQKLDIYQNIRVNIRNQGTQTVFGLKSDLIPASASEPTSPSREKTPKKSRPSSAKTHAPCKPLGDHAVLSELFFTKDPVSAILDPVFFNNKPPVPNRTYWEQ